MRIVYLLPIDAFLGQDAQEELLAHVDGQRRDKASRQPIPANRARSLCAGALLQCAVDWWQKGRLNQDGAGRSATFSVKNGNFPAKRGGFPAESGEFSVKNGEFPAKSGEAPGSAGAECQWVTLAPEEILAALPHTRGLDIRYGERGKPYLTALPLYFNLSHSGGYVACGISDEEIGVDVQETGRTVSMRLADRYFTPKERERLAHIPDKEAYCHFFSRLWAQKESYGKLTGRGVLDAIGTSPLEEQGKLGIGLSEYSGLDGYAACACWRVGGRM